MALLDIVKPRLGVFYSEVNKDLEVLSMINGAIEYFKGAGWVISPASPTFLAVEAVVLYCKMAEQTSPFQLTNHPVLTAFIAQGRSGDDGNV